MHKFVVLDFGKFMVDDNSVYNIIVKTLHAIQIIKFFAFGNVISNIEYRVSRVRSCVKVNGLGLTGVLETLFLLIQRPDPTLSRYLLSILYYNFLPSPLFHILGFHL